MAKKIKAGIYFEDSNNNTYFITTEDYQGYTFANKTKKLIIYTNNKEYVFKDVKFNTLKEKIKK